MYTNTNGCTIYEKTIVNRSPDYVRHEIGAVFVDEAHGQSGGKDRSPDNSVLIIIPESSASYIPKPDDRIVCEVIADDKPPVTALTVMKVQKYLYGSPNVRHVEVTAK